MKISLNEGYNLKPDNNPQQKSRKNKKSAKIKNPEPVGKRPQNKV